MVACRHTHTRHDTTHTRHSLKYFYKYIVLSLLATHRVRSRAQSQLSQQSELTVRGSVRAQSSVFYTYCILCRCIYMYMYMYMYIPAHHDAMHDAPVWTIYTNKYNTSSPSPIIIHHYFIISNHHQSPPTCQTPEGNSARWGGVDYWMLMPGRQAGRQAGR